MPIDATVGGENANSYVATDFVLAYFELAHNEARWLAACRNSDGEKFLLGAMLFIENRRFVGLRATTTQALEFPRYGGALSSPWQERSCESLRDSRDRVWPIDAVPLPVQQAQCEMALAIGENSDVWLNPRLTRKTINGGSSMIELATARDLGRLCPGALLLLQPFLRAQEVLV